MSRQRLNKFKVDPTKSIKVKFTPRVASNTSLTEAQADDFQNNILDLCREIDGDSPYGYCSAFYNFKNTTVTAWNAYYQGLAAAPGAVWPGRPVQPPLLTTVDYNKIMGPIDIDDAAAVAAGGGFAPNAAYEVDETDMEPEDMQPAEFQSVFWQILETMAHSGFSGVGDYHQTLKFTYQGLPDDNHSDHILEMSAVIRAIPAHCTPRNVGVYYAETIARTAKERNIFFDWGIRHGVPDSLNHLGFATWMYIKDPTLLNTQMRIEMQKVSIASIRDKDTYSFMDPSAPHAGDSGDIEFAAELSRLNIQEGAAVQQRIRDARNPSRLSGYTTSSFRPSRRGTTESD